MQYFYADRLTVAKLQDVAKEFKGLQYDKIEKIAKELSIILKEKSYDSEEEIFSIFYEWRKTEPHATIPKLAQILKKCGLLNEACKLDPSCECT